MAMPMYQPELLVTLAEAFYVERQEDDPYGWSGRSLDDGIRHHHKTPHGLGVPMAAWYFGPFFRLLNVRPVDTVAMINRMLDHAAAVRVRHLQSLGGGMTGDDHRPDSTWICPRERVGAWATHTSGLGTAVPPSVPTGA
jgi:hypothetical protein